MNEKDMNGSYDMNQARMPISGNRTTPNTTTNTHFVDNRQNNWGPSNQSNWGIRVDEYPPMNNQPPSGTIQPQMSTNQTLMSPNVGNMGFDNTPNGAIQSRQFTAREPMMNSGGNLHDPQFNMNQGIDRPYQGNPIHTPQFDTMNQEPQYYDDNSFWAKNNNNSRRGQGNTNRRGRNQRGRGFRRGGSGRKPKQERDEVYSSPWKYPINRDANDDKEGYWKLKNGTTPSSNMPAYWEAQIKIMKARTWKFHEKYQAHLWAVNPVMVAGVKPTANIVKDKLVDIIKEFLLEQDLVEMENEVLAIESDEGSDLESSLDFLKDRLSN